MILGLELIVLNLIYYFCVPGLIFSIKKSYEQEIRQIKGFLRFGRFWQ